MQPAWSRTFGTIGKIRQRSFDFYTTVKFTSLQKKKITAKFDLFFHIKFDTDCICIPFTIYNTTLSYLLPSTDNTVFLAQTGK